MTTALPEIDMPHIVSAELIDIISQAILNQPRTLQKIPGPSEVGIPCTRALTHKIAEDKEPRSKGDDPGWLAFIGSCVHAGLEQAFRNDAANRGLSQARYITEHRVNVGTAGGKEIWGNSDLLDIDSGTVVDWKIVGPKRLNYYREFGPGAQYRTQAHLYCRGFRRLGFTVNHAMIMFLPRDNELSKYYCWAEPYSEAVALEGLSRMNGLYELLNVMGKSALLDIYPYCGDWFCKWCKADKLAKGN